ncbi:MAG TPA: universal stress protein [Micromonosporaceae bacterium]|jgi:nucleotide-binding universal stress UspA family protein
MEQRTRVIVGISSSLAGLQALRAAVTAAGTRDAELVAVRSWKYSAAAATEFAISMLEGLMSADADAVVANAFALALGGVPEHLEMRVVAPQGTPGWAILEQVERADDLVVIGAPRRGQFDPRGARVARYCVRRARCPVLIVPAPYIDTGLSSATRRMCRDAQAYARSIPSAGVDDLSWPRRPR